MPNGQCTGEALRRIGAQRATAENRIGMLGLDGILYLIGVRDRDLLDEAV